MLNDFLTCHRARIYDAANEKVKTARWGRLSSGEVEPNWDIFYDKLSHLYSPNEEAHEELLKANELESGMAYLKLGYAITEAVQSYNILYQAILELAVNEGVEFSKDELRKWNLALDTAIVQVVTQFEHVQTARHQQSESERLGFLAHELRNSLQSATIAFELIESGTVSIKGNTGGLLNSSLTRMAQLIDTALTNVRLELEPEAELVRLRVFEVIGEVEVTAAYQARMRDLDLCIQTSNNVEVVVDRQLFISALSNLIQNALKFTHPNGKVYIRTIETEDRVLIEVEDECGGLPEGKIEELFTPGVQSGTDRTGVGLGLAIARRALERNNGELRVRDLPGKGCVFTIDLPKPPSKA